jgi:acetyl esterase/lipase
MLRLQEFRRIGQALALALVLSAATFAAKKPEPPHGPHEAYDAKAEIVIKDVPYVKGKEHNKKLQLDIYSNPHQGLQPVVVMIHGGAWFKGTKSYDNKVYICQVLANHGYVVFTINYRLAPANHLKTQAEDAMGAVIWVKRHAKEYGGDPTRVGVAGGSAGGHLGALVAWASDDPYFIPTGQAGSTLDSDVKAAALYYPVLDLDRTLRENVASLAHLKGLLPLGRLLLVGSVGQRYQEALQHLSPSNHLKASDPPSLFMTGDADSLHLYPQSVEYQKKLQALGVDARLYTAPGKDHGFTWQYWEPETTASVQAMVKLFDQYLKSP